MKNKEILSWLASNWPTLESLANRSHRVLVVHDEEDIQQVNAKVLSRFGYKREPPQMVQAPGKLLKATAAIAGLVKTI